MKKKKTEVVRVGYHMSVTHIKNIYSKYLSRSVARRKFYLFTREARAPREAARANSKRSPIHVSMRHIVTQTMPFR